MKPKDRDLLIRLFIQDGPPCLLVYEYRKKLSGYRQDLPLMKQLIKEGWVSQVEKTGKTIKFAYHFWKIIICRKVLVPLASGAVVMTIKNIIPDMHSWPMLKYETDKGPVLLDAYVIKQFSNNETAVDAFGRQFKILD